MNTFKKWVDSMFGTPAVLKEKVQFGRPNRKQKRVNAATAIKKASASARRKHEKRGAPGRSAKGRRPHRVS